MHFCESYDKTNIWYSSIETLKNFVKSCNKLLNQNKISHWFVGYEIFRQVVIFLQYFLFYHFNITDYNLHYAAISLNKSSTCNNSIISYHKSTTSKTVHFYFYHNATILQYCKHRSDKGKVSLWIALNFAGQI